MMAAEGVCGADARRGVRSESEGPDLVCGPWVRDFIWDSPELRSVVAYQPYAPAEGGMRASIERHAGAEGDATVRAGGGGHGSRRPRLAGPTSRIPASNQPCACRDPSMHAG